MRVERIGDATVYLGDCREVLPTLAKADAVVTDPPYGISVIDATYQNKVSKPGNALAHKTYYESEEWDNDPLDDQTMALIRAAGTWNIIFGGNFYPCPATSCWLVWDKDNGMNDFADCELAWTNLPKAVRRLRFMWNGMLRAHGEPRGDHPTQKPVGVMKWCIGHLPDGSNTILDPLMGSGTTGVAALQMRRKFIVIEREVRYFDIACRRLEDATRQGDLFYAAN